MGKGGGGVVTLEKKYIYENRHLLSFFLRTFSFEHFSVHSAQMRGFTERGRRRRWVSRDHTLAEPSGSGSPSLAESRLRSAIPGLDVGGRLDLILNTKAKDGNERKMVFIPL